MARFELYPALLGEAWHTLPEPVRSCHQASPALVAHGRFSVEHAASLAARIAIAIGALPPSGEDVPLRLDVQSGHDHQIWKRDFGGFVLTTRQSMLADGRLVERRGLLELLFQVRVEDGSVLYHPAGLRLRLGMLAIPIPRWLGPSVVGRAWCEGESMRVKIEIAAPLLGTIVTYGGLLALGAPES